MKPNQQTPEVPGIDDCDMLYSLCSRSGNSSFYIRVQETAPGVFHAATTIDSNEPEGDNFTEDGCCNTGPFKLPEHACAANLEHARAWFRDNGLAFVYDTDSRRVARKYPYGLRG